MTQIKIQLTIKKEIPQEAKIAFLGKELFTELLHQKLVSQKREFFETCEVGKYVIANSDWKESGKQKYLDSIGELEAFVASGTFQEW